MYVWTLSMFVSMHQLIRAVDWVLITLCSFPIRTALSLTSPSWQQRGSWKQVQPPASRSPERSIITIRFSAAYPSFITVPAFPCALSTLILISLKPWPSADVWSGHVWTDCTFVYFGLYFIFPPGSECISLFKSLRDRHVTLGLTGNRVNSSSAHAQPASPPSSWDPTLTPNLNLLQKFLLISEQAMKSLISLMQAAQRNWPASDLTLAAG